MKNFPHLFPYVTHFSSHPHSQRKRSLNASVRKVYGKSLWKVYVDMFTSISLPTDNYMENAINKFKYEHSCKEIKIKCDE